MKIYIFFKHIYCKNNDHILNQTYMNMAITNDAIKIEMTVPVITHGVLSNAVPSNGKM